MVCGCLTPVFNWFSASHSVRSAKDPKRSPPDAALFPYHMQNRQGLWLVWRAWRAPSPKGAIFIVHGFGEHIGRYEALAERFVAEGYSVFGIDHQGHGRSEGDRVHVEAFKHLVDDYSLFVHRRLAEEPEYGSLPRFLLGHSMGGLIAVHLANREPKQWRGVLLSGAALKANPEVATPFLVTVARTLSIITPKLVVGKVEAHMVSSDKQVVEHYESDPLVNHVGTRARFGSELLRAIDAVWDQMDATSYASLLVMHGTNDKLTLPEGSQMFFDRCQCRDKLHKTYAGMYHEIFNEPGREVVIRDVVDFIAARSK